MTTQATVVPRFICGVHTCEEKSRIYSVYIFYRRNNNNIFFFDRKAPLTRGDFQGGPAYNIYNSN